MISSSHEIRHTVVMTATFFAQRNANATTIYNRGARPNKSTPTPTSVQWLFLALILVAGTGSVFANPSGRTELSQRARKCDLTIARAAAEELLRPELAADPLEQITAALALYRLGEKDRAAFWFYAGQLRLRDYLIANPSDGGIVQIFVMHGAPISNHAMHDSRRFASLIDKVLEWDRTTANPVRQDPANILNEPEFEKNRSGLLRLRAMLIAEGPELESRARAEQSSLNSNIEQNCQP